MVNRGLSEPQAYCATGQKKHILPLPAATIQFLGCQAHTPVTTPKIREPWNDSIKHVLENSGLQKSWILNKCLCHAPSSLKSTLKSNIWFKRKFSDWCSIRHETRIVTIAVILFEWFGNVLRWSSEEELKLLYTLEGEELLKKDTEHQRQNSQNQHFCFQLPAYCQEASIYCFYELLSIITGSLYI